jgi:aspartyl/asparaginyl beta-hydroxylase (cupin superfamily)
MQNEREHALCEIAIKERAYAIWEEEGRPADRNLMHWLRAEAEVGPEQVVGILDNAKPVKSRLRRKQ